MEPAIRKLSDEEAQIKERTMRLDELADLHSRISALESVDVTLSRRLTRLEDERRGHVQDDPLSQLFSPSIMWGMLLLMAAPVIIDLIKEIRSSEQ